MGFPFDYADLNLMNQFVVDEARRDAGSAPLMIVKPGMNPREVEAFIDKNGIVNFERAGRMLFGELDGAIKKIL